MKTAVILGGTGLVGKSLTMLLLQDQAYSTVSLLVRNPLNRKEKKLNEIVFDFDNPDRSAVVGDEVFCCLGTTMKTAGSKAAFYKVDHDYVVSLATIAFENGTRKFALVSSMGADTKSAIFYNRTKGETEAALMNIGFETLYIFRPSMLLGDRSEFRLGEKIGKWLMTNLSFLVPKKYKAIEASQVAHAMVRKMRIGETGTHILESAEITSIK